MDAFLPSLHALHCFDAAAHAGSFSAAAREMHLTHGAISRQVRLLESALDVQLFVRGGRKVTLTSEGRELVLTTKRAFATLRDGVGALQRRRGGPVVLSCEPTLTLHWLIPRLGGLQDRYPDLVVHVGSAGGPPDFDHSGADLAIRRKDFAIPPGVDCQGLMDEWLGPVCSPAYAATLGDKARVTLLETRTRPHAFAEWIRATGRRLRAKRTQSFDHFAESIEAAVGSLGLAIGPYPLVLDALDHGRLVAPFGFRRGDVGYVVLSRGSAAADSRVGSVRQWLAAEAKGTKPKKILRDAGATPDVR